MIHIISRAIILTCKALSRPQLSYDILNYMKIKLAILSICFVTLIYLVVSVAVAGLLAAFPQVAEGTVMLVLTLPALSAIIGIGLAALLAPFCSHKTLVLCGLGVLLCAGVASLLLPQNLCVLICAGAAMGIAYGLLATMYPLLVDAHFSGAQRTSVMGIAAGMIQLGRLITVLIGGFLADISWNYVYLTFILVVAAIVIVLLCLPKDLPARDGAVSPSTPKARLWKNKVVWRMCAVGFAFTVIYFLNVTHASLYIEGYGLGTAAATGLLSAITSGIAGVMSFLFAKLFRFTGRFTFAIAFLVMGAGYMIAGLYVSLAAISAGLAAAAVGIALFSPYLMLEATSADKFNAPAATAIILTAVNIGYFISPNITAGIGALLGDGSPADIFLFAGIAAVACALLSFAINCRKVRKPA